MQVDYSKLWVRYKELGHKNKTDLIEMAGISTNILAKLTKGEFISMDSIQRICKALNCDVGDICVINKVEENTKYIFSSSIIGTYTTADNPIDACYEMILKLKEKKLL